MQIGQIFKIPNFADREVCGPYWQALVDCLLHNPPAFRTVVSFAALYLHLRPFAGYMDGLLWEQIEARPSPDVGLAPRLARSTQG